MSANFRIDPKATQYHLEQVGSSLHVGACFRGREYPEYFEILEGTRMLVVLDQLKAAGYSCRIHRDGKGQAIKDEITRIDFMLDRGQWTCKKYPKGWTASTPAIETKQMTVAETNEALAWLKDHKWIVREFPGGFRAWKGELLPVRSRGDILRLARKIDDNIRRGETDPRHRFDLAYDCFDL